MEDLIRELLDGKKKPEEILEEIERRMYGSGEFNIDAGRDHRTGVPEVVIAEGKTDEQLRDISLEFIERTGRVIISRLKGDRKDVLITALSERFPDLRIQYEALPGFLSAKRRDCPERRNGGRVAIITAGTSDIPAAMEAELISRESGCETLSFHDVGVAGLHRLFGPLKKIREWGADVLIVAAGREGALPTLVSGLVNIPVIGLPVSTGYGLHGKGEAALFAMLQSCSPIAVVNIDAGFVAGAVASRMASRCSGSRE